MERQTYKVEFSNSDKTELRLQDGNELSKELTIENSPILFGCRTGVCGTCLCEVLKGSPKLPSEEELELLEVLAPDNANARLACQIKVTCNLTLKYIG